VEVDVDKQTEVIRVPQHNNVGAMDLMNDFEVVSLVFQDLSVVVKKALSH